MTLQVRHIEHIKAWQANGFTQGVYCQQQGLNVKTFSRWFVFPIRPGNRIKVLVWDSTGVWLCQRRLHKGHFIWSKVSDACFLVTRHEDNFQS